MRCICGKKERRLFNEEEEVHDIQCPSVPDDPSRDLGAGFMTLSGRVALDSSYGYPLHTLHRARQYVV